MGFFSVFEKLKGSNAWEIRRGLRAITKAAIIQERIFGIIYMRNKRGSSYAFTIRVHKIVLIKI